MVDVERTRARACLRVFFIGTVCARDPVCVCVCVCVLRAILCVRVFCHAQYQNVLSFFVCVYLLFPCLYTIDLCMSICALYFFFYL